jgi:hypothetical protein
MRSALDAYVDLKNLLQDPTYWMQLEAADSFEWGKLLQAASAPGNQYLASFRSDPDFPDYRRLMKKEEQGSKSCQCTEVGRGGTI